MIAKLIVQFWCIHKITTLWKPTVWYCINRILDGMAKFIHSSPATFNLRIRQVLIPPNITAICNINEYSSVVRAGYHIYYICGHLIDTGVSSNMVVTLSWGQRKEQFTIDNTAKYALTINADTTPEKRQRRNSNIQAWPRAILYIWWYLPSIKSSVTMVTDLNSCIIKEASLRKNGN